MKRASYRDGIDCIAQNDDPSEMDPEVVLGFATVMLLAQIFGVDQKRVAEDVVRYRKRLQIEDRRLIEEDNRRSRSGFTLVELLVVIAIVLVLAAIGAGVVMQGVGWVRHTQTEITLRKVSERLERRMADLPAEVHDKWGFSPALYRRAGGSARRMAVLQAKYLLKWRHPETLAEIGAFIAEAQGLGYVPPDLVALSSRMSGAVPGNLADENAAILLALFELTPGTSSGDLTEGERDSSRPIGKPVLVDSWGTPIRFARNGLNLPLASFPPAGDDSTDPDNLLVIDPADPNRWWSVEGAWYLATFGADPEAAYQTRIGTPGYNAPYLPLAIISAGPDRNMGTADDNLDSLRFQLRVGHGQ